jgi:hypothetical protein
VTADQVQKQRQREVERHACKGCGVHSARVSGM